MKIALKMITTEKERANKKYIAAWEAAEEVIARYRPILDLVSEQVRAAFLNAINEPAHGRRL